PDGPGGRAACGEAGGGRPGVGGLGRSGAAGGLPIPPGVRMGEGVAAATADVRWVAEPSGRAPALAPFDPNASLTGAVGPSRGFSERELRLLLDASFTPVRLGPYRLRTETAAVAMAVHWSGAQPQQGSG